MPDFPNKNTNNCTHCGGKLVAFGNARSNGKNHDDWTGRTLHKKCWKEIRDFGERSKVQGREKANDWRSLGVYLIKE